MSQDNLEELAAKADKVVLKQQTLNDRLKEKAAQPRINWARRVISTLMVATFALVLVHQYPRIVEPYEVANLEASEEVAKVDLEALADLIYLYRISTGHLPISLDEINLPQSMQEFVVTNRVVYRVVEDDFQLRVRLPTWEVDFDSKTNETGSVLSDTAGFSKK